MWQGNKDKIALGATYKVDRKDGESYQIPQKITHCFFGSGNRGLSFGPYKIVVAVKSIDKCSNNKPHDPHGF